VDDRCKKSERIACTELDAIHKSRTVRQLSRYLWTTCASGSDYEYKESRLAILAIAQQYFAVLS